MKTSRLALAAAILAIAAGCVRTNEPAPAVTTPRYPDFMFPAAPAALGERRRCWRFSSAAGSSSRPATWARLGASSARLWPRAAGSTPPTPASPTPASRTTTTPTPSPGSTACCGALRATCRPWSGKADALAGAGRIDDATRLLTEVARRRSVACGRAAPPRRARVQEPAGGAEGRAAGGGRRAVRRGGGRVRAGDRRPRRTAPCSIGSWPRSNARLAKRMRRSRTSERPSRSTRRRRGASSSSASCSRSGATSPAP